MHTQSSSTFLFLSVVDKARVKRNTKRENDTIIAVLEVGSLVTTYDASAIEHSVTQALANAARDGKLSDVAVDPLYVKVTHSKLGKKR